METSKLVQHIKRSVKLSKYEQAILDNYTIRTSLKQYELLIKEGEICNSLYFVGQGCLRMFFTQNKTDELTTQFAIEGWWLTDYFSFIDNKPTEYSIQTLEQSEIISIDKLKYHELLNEIPQLHDYFGIIMQRNVAASQLRIKYLFGMSSEQLFHHFTSSFPEFVNRVPLSMIYSYLGISPEIEFKN
ncbi:Crp/Fnr family transcriptional regulator [Ancylomarina sp. YFZ004]